MPVLADPKTIAGPLNAADVANARQHSTGTLRLVPAGCGQNRWPERRVNFPDTVPVQPAEACTDLGADSCKPPVSRAGIALVLLPWLLGVIGWAVWARWPLF